MDESFSREASENPDQAEQRFQSAKRDSSTYRNCAGFVRYMLGIDEKETLGNAATFAQELTEVGRIELDSFDPGHMAEEEYLALASNAQVLAIQVNKTPISNPKTLDQIINNHIKGPVYVHYAYIDPNDPTMIYERPDLEMTPVHSNWREVLLGLEEFNGMEKYLVFLEK